jgi:exodeoxyribonuclease III
MDYGESSEGAVKIVSWNVNSLKARGELVGLYLDEVVPDVICLQELKLATEAVPTSLFTDRGYEVAVHGQKQWNGVLIASKTPLTDVQLGHPPAEDGQSRFIAATVGGVRIVNLYCPQGQRVDSPKFPYKLAFFDALIAWVKGGHEPTDDLIITGDINIAPAARDIHDPESYAGVPSFHPEEHARLQQLLDWGLIDELEGHLAPNTYTFWDYRKMAFRFNKGMRIDHFLVTESVHARVTEGWMDRPWRKKRGELKASDHAPVGIALS